MNAITVDRLQTADAAIAANVLSHAFVTQPSNIAMWGRQDEYARHAIETLFRVAKLERPVSSVLGARRDNQIVGAVSMAKWPHCQLAPTVWKKHDPKKQHWRLGPIGVLPQLQGQGIGSRMLEKCCETID